MPLSCTLSLGYGLNVTRTGFADGTTNWIHTESLIARWRPADGIEVMPFWTVTNNYNDEAGTFYLPAGRFLPQLPRPDHNEGPCWSGYRYTRLHTRPLASAPNFPKPVGRLGA